MQIPSKATRRDGWTVEIDYVAGGSFTQVVVRDTLGIRAWNRSYRLASDAWEKFKELAAQ